jgi:hypothetical protein
MRMILLAASLTLALPALAQTSTPAAPSQLATIATSQPLAREVKAPTNHAAATTPTVATTAQPAASADAEPQPAPFSQNPIQQLRGNARAILVFAPDTTNPALLAQFAALERDELGLSERDTILVPIITHHHSADESFPGENINPGTYNDQLAARVKFGIKSDEFAIVLLSKDGTELFRSSTPVTVSSLNAHLDGIRDTTN